MGILVFSNIKHRQKAILQLSEVLAAKDKNNHYYFYDCINSVKTKNLQYINYGTSKTQSLKIKILLTIEKLLALWNRYTYRFLLLEHISSFIYSNVIKTEKNTFTKILLNLEIDFAITSGDRHLYLEPALLLACKDNNIPVLISKSTHFTIYESSYNHRKNDKIYSYSNYPTSFKKVIESAGHTLSYQGKAFYPYYITKSLYKTKALPLNPWVMGTGLSSYILLDTSREKNKYVEMGVPPSKIKIYGDISHDNLYSIYTKRQELKESLLKKYNLKASNIIIVSLPQLAENKTISWDSHWKNINRILDSLNKINGYNILVSLHPKMEREKYLHLEKIYNISILTENLNSVLPVAHLFVAGNSSTVFWAVLCGIKTIILDNHNQGYTLFNQLDSTLHLKSIETLETDANSYIAADTSFQADWEYLSKEQIFNGNSLDKYLALINNKGKNSEINIK